MLTYCADQYSCFSRGEFIEGFGTLVLWHITMETGDGELWKVSTETGTQQYIQQLHTFLGGHEQKRFPNTFVAFLEKQK